MAVLNGDDIAGRKPRIRPVPAVIRTVQILKFLAENPEPIGLSKLAAVLEMVPSTCLHILRVLVDEGLVAVNLETKQYALGTGILMLARSFLSESNLVRMVQPKVDALTRHSGVTSAFIESYGSRHLIATAVGESAEMFSVRMKPGITFPRFSSASGRCVAAYSGLAEAELQARFEVASWANPPAFAQWLREVRAVRERGFAIDDGAYVRGVTVVAVPLLNGAEQLRYCIAAASLAGQLGAGRLEVLVRDLRAAARALEAVI